MRVDAPPRIHDHFGHMVRGATWQLCSRATGGCGQRWKVLFNDQGQSSALVLDGYEIPDDEEPF